MKKKISAFIIVFYVVAMLLLVFSSEYSYVFEDLNLNPLDYARITDVDYKAVVVDEPDSQGKVVITERLTFDIHAASKNNPFWELWRDLPEDYVDGVKVDYQVNSVKQILADGTEVIYEKSPKLYWDDYDYVNTNPIYGPGKWFHSKGPYDESSQRYECVFFYVDGLYREEVTFEIEYEMHNAALRYNDCSDLYLALYSGSTIKYLDSFKAQILFPNEDMPAPGNYDVYTYGTNSNDFPVTESATINPGYYTFSFELNEEDLKFRPYNQYIEFDLVSHGEDKHIFTEYASTNYYSFDDVLGEIYEEQQEYASAPERFKTIKIIIVLISSVCGILALLYAFTSGIRLKAKHAFYEPALEIDYFRDIPSDLDPNFAAALVFCKQKPPKDDSGVYSAILLSLARKKYIEITDSDSTDPLITIKKYTFSQQVTLSDIDLDSITESYSTSEIYGTADNFTAPTNFGLTDDLTTEEIYETSDIVAAEETYEPLTPCEEYYYNLLIRHAVGNTIYMSTFRRRISSDYENTEAFAKNMKKSIINIGVQEGYFQKSNYLQPQKHMRTVANFLIIAGIFLTTLVNVIARLTRIDLAFGAFFILGISCIISSVYLKTQSKKYVLLTQFGEDEYAKWRGLYNFLNSDTLMHERTIIELPLWERYLVYATAFGISEKVIKAINIHCPEISESPVLSNTYYRSGRFRSHGHSFRSAVHSGAHGSHGGGGFGGFGGGGFGYGGGGRGGGGGGGGH